MESGYIRITQDLSEPWEAGIGPLVGKTFWGEWIAQTRMYRVTDNGLDWYWIKQDECESAECAFCSEMAMENSCICIDCLNDGMEHKYLAIKAESEGLSA